MDITTLHNLISEEFGDIQTSVDNVLRAKQKQVAQGRKTNIRPLIVQLNRALKSHRVSVIPKVQEEILVSRMESPQWYPQLGGYCYEPKGNIPARIQILLCVHKSSSRLDLTDSGWDMFRFRFLKTLLHELVHRAQFACGRQHKTLVFRPHGHAANDKYRLLEQKYFGELDEIEAYARDCVEEWHYINKTVPLASETLLEEFLSPHRIPSVAFYYHVFNGDVNHPAVKRFLRKVLEWHDIIEPLSVRLTPLT